MVAKDVLALPTRRAIFEVVRTSPGEHLRGIERKVALPFGQVLYHLDRLERNGFVVAKRDGGFKRYFVASLVARPEKDYIAAFRHEIPRKVAVFALLAPGVTHRELAARLPVTGSTLSFHLGKMVEAGILEREVRGNEHLFRVVDERTAAKVLVFYRESWQDPEVDRFADAWLSVNFRPASKRLEALSQDRLLVQRLRGLGEGAEGVAAAVLRSPEAPQG